VETGSPARKFGLALVIGAGLAGAAGVALAAVAAHKVESPALATAANMLVMHAAAVTAIVALARSASAPRPLLWAGALMLAASSLFGADVAMHAITGARLFPYAAPTGGSLTILSWLALAAVAVRAYWRGED